VPEGPTVRKDNHCLPVVNWHSRIESANSQSQGYERKASAADVNSLLLISLAERGTCAGKAHTPLR